MKILSALIRTIMVTALFAGLNSCKKEDPKLIPDPEGSFEVTVTGAEEAELTGVASFDEVIVKNTQPGVGGATLELTLGAGEEFSLTIILTKKEDSSFGKGTYSFIENNEELLISIIYFSPTWETVFVIESGSVELTKVSDKWIEGNFNARLSDFSGKIVNLSGSFKADGLTLTYG